MINGKVTRTSHSDHSPRFRPRNGSSHRHGDTVRHSRRLWLLQKCAVYAAAEVLLELHDAPATIARMVVNWRLSKTTLGCRRARPHADRMDARWSSRIRWSIFPRIERRFRTPVCRQASLSVAASHPIEIQFQAVIYTSSHAAD